jgi:hypothetical protein
MRIFYECSQVCQDLIAVGSRALRLLSFLTVHKVTNFHQTRNFHDVFAWEKLICFSRSIARVPKSTSRSPLVSRQLACEPLGEEKCKSEPQFYP